MKNLKEFHPPHLYLSESIYFLTSKTINGEKIFSSEEKLEKLFSIIVDSAKKENILLYGWVILHNHNHILVYIKLKKDLISFMKRFHGKSTIEINKLDFMQGRKIWYQYWDRCIRSERDFWIRLNYIHYNPVKHGYTDDMFSYKFSSIKEYLNKYGKDWVYDCFRKYPVKDFMPEKGMD
jgi:putative transposase